jgi:uncharacterized protein (DUF1499 family)
MAWLQWVLGTVVVGAVGVIAAGQLGAFSGRAPTDLGVRDGRLKPPSRTPNSVSSQAALYPDHPQRGYAQIAPIALVGDGPATIAALRRVVETMRGAKVVESRADYLYVQFTTRLMGYVDDAEFWFDPAAGVVQLRSASRVGRKDFGVNRERVEAIRQGLPGAPKP